MAVTQMNSVKELPYILSNILSIFTVMPLAVAVLAVGIVFPVLFGNMELRACGVISYEIYLVHVFTLEMIGESFVRVVAFMAVTLILAYALYVVERGIKNGRLNSNHTNKK